MPMKFRPPKGGRSRRGSPALAGQTPKQPATADMATEPQQLVGEASGLTVAGSAILRAVARSKRGGAGVSLAIGVQPISGGAARGNAEDPKWP